MVPTLFLGKGCTFHEFSKDSLPQNTYKILGLLWLCARLTQAQSLYLALPAGLFSFFSGSGLIPVYKPGWTSILPSHIKTVNIIISFLNPIFGGERYIFFFKKILIAFQSNLNLFDSVLQIIWTLNLQLDLDWYLFCNILQPLFKK